MPRAVVVGLVLLAARGTGAAEESDDVVVARQRFALGQILFKQDKYADALVEFEAAQKTLHRAEFDYNIGLCLSHLARPIEAADALERYIEARPSDPEAATIWQTIATLRRRVKEDEQKVAPVTPPHEEKPPLATPVKPPIAPPPPPPLVEKTAPAAGDERAVTSGWLSRPRHRASLGLGIGALALVVAGVVTGTLARSDRSSYDAGCDLHRCDQSLYDSASSWAHATDALLGVGLVAAVAAIVLFATAPSEVRLSASGVRVSF